MSALAEKVNASNVVSIAEFKRGRLAEPEQEDFIQHESKEVYPFSEHDVELMLDYFNKKIDDAPGRGRRRQAMLSKLMFVTATNTALRASDIRELRWAFFFDADGKFNDSYKVMPKKTRRSKKYVTVYLNDAIKRMVKQYTEEFGYDIDEYVFLSQRNTQFAVSSMWRIIKSAAEECGIKQNIGTHSCRKTFCTLYYKNAQNKTEALVLLQALLNHSSTAITSRYIGLTAENIEDAYMTTNVGIRFI